MLSVNGEEADMPKQDKGKLELLEKEFDALVEKMQTPKARAAVASVSKATTKDLAKAAAQYRRNEESKNK